MNDILITGGTGVVGSYMDFGIHTDRSELDVTDTASIASALTRYKPKTIVHLAALTDLAFCETHPEEAERVNAKGTEQLAKAAREIGAKLVYISTSGVFDGTKAEPYIETDIPNPINVYGRSKYAGERALQSLLDDYLIVRTSWIFGGGEKHDTKFVGKILAQKEQPQVRAVTDRRGSPTYAKDLARAIRTLIEQGATGIVHAGTGDATRFDVAKEALALVGSKAEVVHASSADFRSAYQSGANESMPLSLLMRPWQEALKEYIETEWGS